MSAHAQYSGGNLKKNKLLLALLIMATQNIAPPDHHSSQKGTECSSTGPVDGQSVSKRLQQDLMTLMVREYTS